MAGASTLISRLHLLYRTFQRSNMPNLLMQRVIEFAPEHAPAITALSDFVDAAVVKREKMVATSFDIALSNYTRSHEHGDHYDRIVVSPRRSKPSSRAATTIPKLWVCAYGDGPQPAVDRERSGRAIFETSDLYALRSPRSMARRSLRRICSSGSIRYRPFPATRRTASPSRSPLIGCATSSADRFLHDSASPPETTRCGGSKRAHRSTRRWPTKWIAHRRRQSWRAVLASLGVARGRGPCDQGNRPARSRGRSRNRLAVRMVKMIENHHRCTEGMNAFTGAHSARRPHPLDTARKPCVIRSQSLRADDGDPATAAADGGEPCQLRSRT